MRYKAINPELFVLNRKRFAREMEPGTLAIFHSNDRMPRNGDTFYPFRQNSDLFYLCGLDQEETVLVLFPDCVKEGFQELVFIKKTNSYIARWEGKKYTKEDARRVSGIEKVYWLEDMDSILRELLFLSKGVYINVNENDHFSSPVPTADARYAHSLRERYPALELLRAQPILKKLAMIKSEYELPLIQEAVNITRKAFLRVMDMVRPGMMEYEIEAEITHEFIRNRANGHAYDPIIASGANSCVLHYVQNNQPCKDGDLLLMDFGAEYANYAADMTRVIPVNGRFTKRQREVYNAVLRVMKAAKALLVPGTQMTEYHQEVGKLMESELLGLGLLDKTDIKNQDPRYPAYKKYFMHGTSHHIGLDVHDLCNRYDPVQAGMVFTCEPGIYIEEEQIGIRLENDILVTDDKPVDLMDDIPVEAEEIEMLIKQASKHSV
jgi:Xaa-Pro aminopeptidase